MWRKFRDFCLSLAGSTECMPFDDETLVFKVGGKMFAFIPLEKADQFHKSKMRSRIFGRVKGEI